MLGRLRRWRNIISREAGLLGRFLSMSRAEIRAALTAPPLPNSWQDSVTELNAIF